MRYLGGLLGGTWLTALSGDLGKGIFDGANLVANFESLNPANTYWTKPYNLYSKVDTEAARFLDFETWWGSPVLLNAEEMQWIADNLFVGNRLSTGQIRTADGVRIDLRNITAPIIVFCSWGDDITPPHQALGWVLDLYDSEREIVENGQTIVYTMHQSIGHLGIFVSGKVATKEHGEFVSCMELIDAMPPGLYEAVITEVDDDTVNPDLVQGKYLFRLEARTLDHIRALGGNDAADDFAVCHGRPRVRDQPGPLPDAFAAPAVRMAVTDQAAEALRATHPNRLRFAMFSDQNPLMQPVKALADSVRVGASACQYGQSLAGDGAGDIVLDHDLPGNLRRISRHDDRSGVPEHLWFAAGCRRWLGLGTQDAPAHRLERDLVREANTARLRSELEHRFESGVWRKQ